MPDSFGLMRYKCIKSIRNIYLSGLNKPIRVLSKGAFNPNGMKVDFYLMVI